MITISIVVPIFNEEDNIKRLFEEIFESGAYDKVTDIIFVNDCSSDTSKLKIEKIIAKNSKVTCISHDKNLGQSSCIYSAALYSKNECLITIDGDCQNNPKDINKLIDIYSSNKFKLVGGIRNKRKDSFIKVLSSRVANKVRVAILDDDCIDTGCSLKIFNREFFLKLPFFDGIHRFLPALFKAYGAKTFFVNVDHRFRKYGKSKYDTFGRLFRGIRDIIKVLVIIRRNKKNHV